MPGSHPIKIRISKNNDQAFNVSSKLKTFYDEKKFVDVTLITSIDNAKLKAHWIVLSASSDYCQELSETTQAKPKEIKLKDIDGPTLRSLVLFMYTGSIELRTDMVKAILKAAIQLKMNTLIATCINFMQEELDPYNCLGIAFLAQEQGFTDLHKKALGFALNHFEKVSVEEEFLKLNETQLKGILSSDDLHVDPQEKVFQSLMAWLKFDEKNRAKAICYMLLQNVPLESLKTTSISKSTEIACANDKFCEWLWSWLDWYLSPTSPTKKIVFTYNGENTLRVQIYDPKLNNWTFADWPNPTPHKVDYGMFVMGRKFIIAGGKINDKATNGFEYLDLNTLKWIKLPSLKQDLLWPTLAELNGKLYCVGGFTGKHWVPSMERYDFSTRNWESLPDCLQPVSFYKSAVLKGLLYVSGREVFYLQCYNPATNQWTKTESRRNKLKNTSIAAVDGYIYAVGGNTEDGGRSNIVERYDPSTNTWTEVESLEVGRNDIACAARNDNLLTLGGIIESGATRILEEYNPRTDEWFGDLPPLLPLKEIAMWFSHLAILEI